MYTISYFNIDICRLKQRLSKFLDRRFKELVKKIYGKVEEDEEDSVDEDVNNVTDGTLTEGILNTDIESQELTTMLQNVEEEEEEESDENSISFSESEDEIQMKSFEEKLEEVVFISEIIQPNKKGKYIIILIKSMLL